MIYIYLYYLKFFKDLKGPPKAHEIFIRVDLEFFYLSKSGIDRLMAEKKDSFRVEKDSLGEVLVPADKLWGAQTQRSLQHFSIGEDLIPKEMIEAYALLKKGAALANSKLGHLPKEKAQLIIHICDEIL